MHGGFGSGLFHLQFAGRALGGAQLSGVFFDGVHQAAPDAQAGSEVALLQSPSSCHAAATGFGIQHLNAGNQLHQFESRTSRIEDACMAGFVIHDRHVERPKSNCSSFCKCICHKYEQHSDVLAAIKRVSSLSSSSRYSWSNKGPQTVRW